MVCIPCFIIPVLLFVWHKFIQPFVLRFWNPWEKKDAQGNVIKEAKGAPDLQAVCKDGVCSLRFVSAGSKDCSINSKEGEGDTKDELGATKKNPAELTQQSAGVTHQKSD